MFNELFLEDFRIFQNQSITIGKTLTAIAGHNATGKSTVLGVLGNACELKSKFGTTIKNRPCANRNGFHIDFLLLETPEDTIVLAN